MEEVSPVPNLNEYPLFRSDKYDLAFCRSQLKEALLSANTKAEAVRKIRQLCVLGYMNIDSYTDEQKAALITPYAEGKFAFTRFDFQRTR